MSDRLYRLLRRFVEIRPEEALVVGWCWLFIFAVLSSYYIMRPIRDEAGVAGGVNNLQWLFTGTLLGMVLLNIPFAFLVKKLPRRRFIPITYHFFAVNIVVFAALLHWADAQQTVWIGRIFFIWVSVYNLFVVSVFWQLNVDLFSPEQSKRLFGLIAAGASIGAIVGSSVTAGLARHVSPIFLLLGAAVLLEIAVFSVGRLSRLSPALHRGPTAPAADEAPIGGSIFAGITRAFGSRYLVNISLFVLLFTVTSTILYFQQAGIVSNSISGRGAQTAFFATVDLCVNILTLGIQLFLTGRIVVLLGVALTLGLLPALTIIGFGTLALMPTIAAVAVFQVLRRAGDYAITRPTREVLFTVVPREDRYKAKSFIDTVVYRAGDQIGAWSVALLRGAGLGTAEMALVALPLAALWLVDALWLGRRQERLAAAQSALAEPHAPAGFDRAIVEEARTPVGFGGAIAACFRKYAVFSGRARRSEFWFWVLFQTSLVLGLTIVDVVALHSTHGLSDLAVLALALPSLAVSVRRLHDIDVTGWWVLLSLVPVIGSIILAIMACKSGTLGPNRFGPEPALPPALAA